MISIDTIPALLLAGIAALVVTGLAVVVWGRLLPRGGDWAVGIPLVYLYMVLGMGWNALSEQHFSPRFWSRGWIWPHDQPGAITVGIILDPLGVVLAALAALVAGLFLLDLSERSPKNFGAVALSSAGVILTWMALTPWTAFCGMVLAIFGGFLSLGTRWEKPRDSLVAARFAWERCWGLLLAVLGLCVLAGARTALEFGQSTEWVGSSATAEPLADWIGMSLLVLGLFVQFQPFPFFGDLVADSEQSAPSRLLLRQIFPGWCAFALLLRIEPHLESAGAFFSVNWRMLGWVAFASAALAVASGLVQRGWKSGLSLWTSAAFCASVGALSFAGAQSATALLLGASLGALVLARAGEAFESDASAEIKTKAKSKEDAPVPPARASRARWLKAAAVFGAASATGTIGFLSAGGALGLLLANIEQPFVLAAGTIVFFLTSLLGWSFVWKIARLGQASRVSWVSVAITFTLIVLSFGVLWTGTASGGAILDSPDSVFGSLFTILFPQASRQAAPGRESTAFVTASGLHWGALVIGALVSFWTTGRREGAGDTMTEGFPRFSSFLASGYGVDRAFGHVRSFFVRSAEAIEWVLNERLWKNGLPALFARPIRGMASAVVKVDEKLTEGLGVTIRRGVEAPAKCLQLIQNGDVRWYLLFAIGSGFLILLHFARTLG